VVPLLSSSQEGGFLRMRYYRWPSRLVLVEDCARILNVSGNTATVATTSVENVLSLSDVVKPTQPFESVGDNVERDEIVDEVGGNTILGFVSMPVDAEVGDYLCPAGATCFPQLPLAYHDALVTAVVARVLREMKDRAGAADAKADLADKLDGALVTISPRDKESQVIANRTWF
jgi:hypothetical protein